MSETDYTNFLLAVVNAEEKAEFKGARRRFARLYSEWFPTFDPEALPWQQGHYHRTRAWRKPPSGEIPIEPPDEQFGLHAVIFGHKLRVICEVPLHAIDTHGNTIDQRKILRMFGEH